MVDGEKLRKIAEVACDAAVSNGAEFADVSAYYGKNLSVDIESSAIKSSDARLSGGISVRAIYRGGTGWSSCDALTPEAAAEAGASAAKLSRLAEPDPDFVSLPQPVASYPEVPGLADRAIAELDIGQMIKYSLANIDEALAVSPGTIVGGGFSSHYHSGALVNSLGVSLARDGSYVGGHIMAVIRSGDDVGSFYDFDGARTLPDFDGAQRL